MKLRRAFHIDKAKELSIAVSASDKIEFSRCDKGKVHIGTLKYSDLKVRKKSPPPTQVQKSAKDYDRKRIKEESRREINDE